MDTATRTTQAIGWFGSILSALTYISFIDQICLNLSGHPGSAVLAVCITIASMVWTIYGYRLTPRSYPIVVCNVMGTVFGAVTVVTTLYPSSVIELWAALVP